MPRRPVNNLFTRQSPWQPTTEHVIVVAWRGSPGAMPQFLDYVACGVAAPAVAGQGSVCRPKPGYRSRCCSGAGVRIKITSERHVSRFHQAKRVLLRVGIAQVLQEMPSLTSALASREMTISPHATGEGNSRSEFAALFEISRRTVSTSSSSSNRRLPRPESHHASDRRPSIAAT